MVVHRGSWSQKVEHGLLVATLILEQDQNAQQ